MQSMSNLNYGALDNKMTGIEFSDADIIDAMKHISGYIDITPGDFRELYHLAYRHAIGRLLAKTQPATLMKMVQEPLLTHMPLDQAVRILVRSPFNLLPVLDQDARVVGILSDSDFLRWHKANSFLEILLNKMADNSLEFNDIYRDTTVSAIIALPTITVNKAASLDEIIHLFCLHDLLGIPVVDADNHFLGLLLRKDVMDSCGMMDCDMS